MVPLACTIASLFLFRHLAGLLLRGTALVAAFGIFAVAYPPIRYAAEAKPYACDLLLALLMLVMLVHWLRRPGENRWLWGLAALIAPAVGFSYPAILVGGAVSLIVAYFLWTAPCRGWRPWIVFNLLLAASFLAVLVVSRTAVGTNQELMEGCWKATFPPLAHPIQLIGWLIATHTGSMMGYPLGGPGGGSTLTFLCCLVGLAWLLRRRQWLLLALLLTPLGLNFVAAALHRFPYGEFMRFALYSALTFCVLSGLGVVAVLQWFARRRPQPQPLRATWAVLVLLVLVAAGSIVRDLTHPYKSGLTLRSRDFAQWFWFDLAHDSELVCLYTDCNYADCKKDLAPRTFLFGWSALYLCNQRIYSPRHARGEPPHLERSFGGASAALRALSRQGARPGQPAAGPLAGENAALLQADRAGELSGAHLRKVGRPAGVDSELDRGLQVRAGASGGEKRPPGGRDGYAIARGG